MDMSIFRVFTSLLVRLASILPSWCCIWLCFVVFVSLLSQATALGQPEKLCKKFNCPSGSFCKVKLGVARCLCPRRYRCSRHVEPICTKDGRDFANICLAVHFYCKSDKKYDPTHFMDHVKYMGCCGQPSEI